MIPGLWGQTSADQTSAADNFPQRPGPSRSVGGFTPSRYSWTVRADQPGSPYWHGWDARRGASGITWEPITDA